MSWQVIHGDCLDALRAMPDASVDAVVTDPPYGLSFMGKKWDYDVPATDVWAECLRVLKPGGHLLAFAGTRTQHRMCVRIEDAGFEIRDMIAWVYGSGFPKSHNLKGEWSGWGTALKPSWESVTWATKPTSEQSERATIVSNLSRLEARLWLLLSVSAAAKSSRSNQSEYDAACGTAQWDADAITNLRAALCDQMDTSQFESATTTALNIVSSWNRILAESWGRESTFITETESSTTTDLRTLKFSLSQITPESIVAACSRPGGFDANASLAERHFSASVALLRSIHTLSATGRAMSRGAENSLDAGVSPSLDPCIMARKPLTGTVAENVQEWGTGAINVDGCRVGTSGETFRAPQSDPAKRNGAVGKDIGITRSSVTDFQAAQRASIERTATLGRWPANLIHDGSEEVVKGFPQTTKGTASGYNWQESGNDNPTHFIKNIKSGVHFGDSGSASRFFYCAKASKADRNSGGVNSNHPTVKPTDLMRYLCRLVTPPGGTVLDPFTGSGSTGKAAILEGFNFIGIERESEYVEIAKARIADAERRHSENLVSA
jgi:DNA modification methylase